MYLATVHVTSYNLVLLDPGWTKALRDAGWPRALVCYAPEVNRHVATLVSVNVVGYAIFVVVARSFGA